MSRPDDLGDLEKHEFDELDQLAERFVRAWEVSPASARIEDFLPENPKRFRVAVLCELVKIDLERRWKRDEQVFLDEYLKRFTDLEEAKDISRLIFEEFRVRHSLGHRPQLQTYKRRFPDQFDALRRMIEKEEIPVTDMPGDATSASDPHTCADIRIFAPGTVLDNQYKLIEKIGEGTFGQVWKASAFNNELVAIKIPFKPLNRKETTAELANLGQIHSLHHEFLLETKKFWAEGGYLFIVMELADEGTLKERLIWHKSRDKSGIPEDELLQYFHDAAQALDYLHAQDMIHRDIKPHNILLVGGKAKLADFGLARQLRADASMTHTEGGTIAYMAPEMMDGRAYRASDQYCFAITYIELRQGRLPFRGSLTEMLKRENPDLRMPPIKPHEKEVLLKALAKDPHDRFDTCGDFIDKLSQVLQFSPASASKRSRQLAAQVAAGPAVAETHFSVVVDVPDSEANMGTRLLIPSEEAPEPHEQTQHPLSDKTDPPKFHAGVSTMDPPVLPVDPLGTIVRDKGHFAPHGTVRPATSRTSAAKVSEAVIPAEKVSPFPPPPRPGPSPSRSYKKLLPILVLPVLLAVWALAHSSAAKEVRSLIQRGKDSDAEAFPAALKVVQGSWVIGPWRSHWREDIEKAWWQKIGDDSLPSSADVKTLQKHQHDLLAFVKAFAEHEPGQVSLKANESAIAGKVRDLIDDSRFDQAEDAIQHTEWSLPETRNGLECLVSNRRQLDDIDGLIRTEKYRAALAKVKTVPWCQDDASGAWTAKIADGWSRQLRQDETAGILPDLIAQHAKLREFEVALPKHEELIEPLRNKNELAIARLIDNGLKSGKIDFPEAMAAVQCVQQAGLKEELRDKIQRNWFARFEVRDQDLESLKFLEKELVAFKSVFPGEAADARQVTIRKAIEGFQEVSNLRESAEAHLKKNPPQFPEAFSVIKRMKDNAEAKDLRERAETKFASALAKLSSDRKYEELDKCLSDVDRRGIEFAAPELKTNLPKYRLEAAWAPFLTGEVRPVEMRSRLEKLRSADDRNYRALTALTAAYESRKIDDAVIDLANVPDVPAGYRHNLLTALVQLEKKYVVFTSDHVFTLELSTRSWPFADKKSFYDVLDGTLQRMIGGGWAPERWDRCRDFCDAVVSSAKPNNWIRALQAECKLELSEDVEVTGLQAGLYGDYVQARVLAGQQKWTEAAKYLYQQHKHLPEALKSSKRIVACQKLLRTATARLKLAEPHMKLFANPTDAGLAYDWLQLARRPDKGDNSPVSASVDLLMAAAKKSDPDHELVRQLAQGLLQNPKTLGPAAYPLLQCYALALGSDDFKRFHAYAKVVEIVAKDDLRKVKKEDLIREALLPGVELGRTVAKLPEDKLRLAELLVSLGRTRGELSGLKTVDDLAVEAIAVAPQFWGGYGLKGSILLEQARQSKGKLEYLGGGLDQIAAYEKAIEQTDKALALAAGDADGKAGLHLERSIESLHLGNFVLFSTFASGVNDRFRQALEHGEKAKELYSAEDKALAWQAIGNAHEDLAYYGGENHFPQALEAFAQSVEIARKYKNDPTYALISKGRCHYRHWLKSAADSGAAKHLQAAEKDLNEAVAGAKLTAHEVEARLFLAKVRYELGADATDVLKEMDAVIEKEKKLDYTFFAQRDAAAIALSAAQKALKAKDYDKATAFIARGRKYVEESRYRDYSPEAGRRRDFAKLQYDLDVQFGKSQDADIMPGAFAKYLPKKLEPDGADCLVLIEQLRVCNVRCDPGGKTMIRTPIDQAAVAEKAAAAMAEKAAKYPREQFYWLQCRRDAFAAMARGCVLLYIDDTSPKEKKKKYLDEALVRCDECIKVRQEMERVGNLKKSDVLTEDWFPYFVRGHACVIRHVNFKDRADLDRAKEALNACLEKNPNPTSRELVQKLLKYVDSQAN